MRAALAPSRCFLELNHDERKTVVLASSGRSGSTWLAGLINHRRKYRLIFEPFRRDLLPWARGFRFGQYVDPTDEDPAFLEPITAVLQGRVRHEWVDQDNTCRVARRRLVKTIRGTNLLPLLRRRFPDLPVVYLIRHPLAVADSCQRAGWRDFVEEFVVQDALLDGPLRPFRSEIERVSSGDDPFERQILRWCMENYVPLSRLDPAGIHFVHFEHLIDNPTAELERLGSYLGDDRLGGLSRAETALPSRTTVDDSPVWSSRSPVDSWNNSLETHTVEAGLRLVRYFGLGRIYDCDPRPRKKAPLETTF